MDELVRKGNKSVGKIFDKILDRLYHQEVKQIFVNELLDWDIWQTFLQIYGTKCQMYAYCWIYFAIIAGDPMYHSKFKLSEKFITMCTLATSSLENMCNQIESGCVTLLQLSVLKKRESQINDLLGAAYPNRRVKAIQQNLRQRFEEQVLMGQWLKRLKQVCHYLTVPIAGEFRSGS